MGGGRFHQMSDVTRPCTSSRRLHVRTLPFALNSSIGRCTSRTAVSIGHSSTSSIAQVHPAPCAPQQEGPSGEVEPGVEAEPEVEAEPGAVAATAEHTPFELSL